MRRKLFIILILFQTFLEGIEADLSFLIADMKYSKEEGVKICEVQQGTLSVFRGIDYLNGTDCLVESSVVENLLQYPFRIFYKEHYIASKALRQKLANTEAHNFSTIRSLIENDDFLNGALIAPNDPENLFDYHTLVISSPKIIPSVSDFKERFPGVLVLDQSSYPYWIDKYKMSELFKGDPILETIKPAWGLYPKVYHQDLATTITDELKGEIFVIKPRGSFKGNGVIIVEKNNLDNVLQLILRDKNRLKYEKDPAMKYWASERNTSFIVERFHASDPVKAPFLDNEYYDGTIRTVFLIRYHKKEIEIDFIESHWKLPKLPLKASGSLNERHKSFGEPPHFAAVPRSIQVEVERQLREALPILYKRMLGIEAYQD